MIVEDMMAVLDGGNMWDVSSTWTMMDTMVISEESMGMWYICQSVTMVDGDMWFCEAPPHEVGK